MSADLKDNKALQNVISALKFHQTNTESRKLVRFIEKQNPSLVNDYIQVFKELLNGNLHDNHKNFEAIHNLLIQSLDKIDIKTSHPLQRFYDDNNYTKFKDKSARFYSNLLDSLYVYFLHSYDLGYKIKGNVYNDDEQKDGNDSDIQITKLKNFLNNKQSQLKDVIPNYLNQNQDNDDLKQNYDHFEYYSYGKRYNYWIRGTDEMYTNKKYDNLKDELVNNTVYAFNMDLLKYVMGKATMLLNTADELKRIVANKEHGDDWYIIGGNPLELSHVVVVLICADIPKALRAFTNVICGDAQEKEEKELNYEIYQFSRLIREAVECYGTELTDCKYDRLYYPINTLDSLLFGEYIARFNHPMITTPCIESALISTDNGNGYILELVEHDSRLTYFDLSWFSANMMAEQLLFCGGALPLRIVNIKQVALDKNYKTFVSALSVLDTIIKGERPNERPSKDDLRLIMKILNKDNAGFSEYIKNLFEYYVICVKRININFYFFNDYFGELIGILTSDETEYTVLIGNVIKYFPFCEYIGIESDKGIDANEKYLNGLLGIVSKLEKENALKQIELKNATFEEAVVFDTFMESFFNAGFDISMEKKMYDISLMFKAVDQD